MWFNLNPESPDEAYLIGTLAGAGAALAYVAAMLSVVAFCW
jgi:hypothetical protein